MNIGRFDYLGGTVLAVVRSDSWMELPSGHMGVHSTSPCHGRTEPPVQKMGKVRCQRLIIVESYDLKVRCGK